MLLDVSVKKLPEVMRQIEQKRQEMVLHKIVKELKTEYEPEMDPFEEARLEAEKRHADRLRKSAANKKK